MPIYEYVCMKCESHFEELVRYDDAAPACPDCGAADARKQLSVFAAVGAERETPSLGGGGGCCGGSCGCG
jgi:putative FmdB family regulatory protein